MWLADFWHWLAVAGAVIWLIGSNMAHMLECLYANVRKCNNRIWLKYEIIMCDVCLGCGTICLRIGQCK